MASLTIQTENNDIINFFDTQLSAQKLNFDYKFKIKNKNSFDIYYKNNDSKIFNEYISNIIATVIITFMEPLIINRILNLDYCYFTPEEKKEILNRINYEEKIDKIHFNSLLFFPIHNYLLENNIINIEGFTNFRLENLYSYIENIVEMKVHEFLINEEYLKFVNLIKNYVDSKIPDNIIVNLIYYNSTAILLTEKGETIKLDNFNSIYLSDISFSNNDYVLNTLVGILPSSIKIHCTSNSKDQFIKTIELIFGNKVSYCKGCLLCKTYKSNS